MLNTRGFKRYDMEEYEATINGCYCVVRIHDEGTEEEAYEWQVFDNENLIHDGWTTDKQEAFDEAVAGAENAS